MSHEKRLKSSLFLYNIYVHQTKEGNCNDKESDKNSHHRWKRFYDKTVNKHQGFGNAIGPEESRLRDRSLHETGFCSRKGKTGDVSGSERANIINHLYEQMVLERLGNKNGQIFFNQ